MRKKRRATPRRTQSTPRWVHITSGIGGALLGGVIGYGFISGGGGKAPSLLEPAAAAWVFGLATVCGLLTGIWPRTAWRPSRKYGWYRRDWP